MSKEAKQIKRQQRVESKKRHDLSVELLKLNNLAQYYLNKADEITAKIDKMFEIKCNNNNKNVDAHIVKQFSHENDVNDRNDNDNNVNDTNVNDKLSPSEIKIANNQIIIDCYTKAIDSFKQALKLIPVPREKHDLAGHFYAFIGDVYFRRQLWKNAKVWYEEALKCDLMEEDNEKHLIWLYKQYGQTLFELGKLKDAKLYLSTAYLKGGKQIFQLDDKKYLEHLIKVKGLDKIKLK